MQAFENQWALMYILKVFLHILLHAAGISDKFTEHKIYLYSGKERTKVENISFIWYIFIDRLSNVYFVSAIDVVAVVKFKENKFVE